VKREPDTDILVKDIELTSELGGLSNWSISIVQGGQIFVQAKDVSILAR
jgi:hypothetical protein